MFYTTREPVIDCMSGIALIGAALAILIINVVPSVLPMQLTGQFHLLYVLVSLFVGILVYQGLNQ